MFRALHVRTLRGFQALAPRLEQTPLKHVVPVALLRKPGHFAIHLDGGLQ
jgi:hypothetical protein